MDINDLRLRAVMLTVQKTNIPFHIVQKSLYEFFTIYNELIQTNIDKIDKNDRYIVLELIKKYNLDINKLKTIFELLHTVHEQYNQNKKADEFCSECGTKLYKNVFYSDNRDCNSCNRERQADTLSKHEY